MLNQPYGKSERQRYDLFTPEGGLDVARGLLAIVHGGYWMALSKDDFSHLAAGPLARGWAVAMIGYTLAPLGADRRDHSRNRGCHQCRRGSRQSGRSALPAIPPAAILWPA